MPQMRDASGKFVSGAATRFIPNPNFEEELVRSTEAKTMLAGLVDRGSKAYAEGVPTASEDLRESVFGVVGLTEDGFVGRIGATDWKAGLVELGTSKKPARPALRDAVEAIGLELTPEVSR